MTIPTILTGLVLAAGPPAEATAADAITLRDGKVILGQVVEPVLGWIDGEIDRLQDDKAPLPPLLLVALNRGDVKAVARRSKDAGRWLRQGWRTRLADVETKPIEDLKQALAGRGIALGAID